MFFGPDFLYAGQKLKILYRRQHDATPTQHQGDLAQKMISGIFPPSTVSLPLTYPVALIYLVA